MYRALACNGVCFAQRLTSRRSVDTTSYVPDLFFSRPILVVIHLPNLTLG